MAASDLFELIATDRLRVGTKLHHHGRRSTGRDGLEATVVKDGIRFEGRVYTTPSAAAKSVTGGRVDGWTFWRTPDGKRLSELR